MSDAADIESRPMIEFLVIVGIVALAVVCGFGVMLGLAAITGFMDVREWSGIFDWMDWAEEWGKRLGRKGSTDE